MNRCVEALQSQSPRALLCCFAASASECTHGLCSLWPKLQEFTPNFKMWVFLPEATAHMWNTSNFFKVLGIMQPSCSGSRSVVPRPAVSPWGMFKKHMSSAHTSPAESGTGGTCQSVFEQAFQVILTPSKCLEPCPSDVRPLPSQCKDSLIL